MELTILGFEQSLSESQEEKGFLHVHKAGCRDIAKYSAEAIDTSDTREFLDVEEVVCSVYERHIQESDETWVGYAGEFYFAPCVLLSNDGFCRIYAREATR